MLKKIGVLLAIVAMFLLGGYLVHRHYQVQLFQKETSAQVLLERVQAVTKLITVEGYFSELYDYKDHYYFDISPFQKKALLRVKAKVSVGYDLEKLKIETDETTKTLTISNMPDPQILSIDHEIDYYDLQNGAFNSFSSKELTQLNQNAKDLIEENARKSTLFEQAENQSVEMMDMIKLMVESAGWTVETRARIRPELLN
ncbi:MAG: hypothetical protein ACI9XO_001525 [Paraglaciecola sp.]|jgi:hypothetical protein